MSPNGKMENENAFNLEYWFDIYISIDWVIIERAHTNMSHSYAINFKK